MGQDQGRGNTAHGMAFRRHTLAWLMDLLCNQRIPRLLRISHCTIVNMEAQLGGMERKNMEMGTVDQNTVSHSEKKKIGLDHLRGSFLDDRSG